MTVHEFRNSATALVPPYTATKFTKCTVTEFAQVIDGTVSLTRQCQIRRHAPRPLPAVIRHQDLEPVRGQADDPHIGRHLAHDRLGPVDQDIDRRTVQPAGQPCRPDPRPRIGPGHPAGPGIDGQVGADRPGEDQIGPAGAIERDPVRLPLQHLEVAAHLAGRGIRPVRDHALGIEGAGVAIERRGGSRCRKHHRDAARHA